MEEESSYPVNPNGIASRLRDKGPKMPAARQKVDYADSAFSDDFGELPPLLQQYNAEYRKYIDLIDQLRAFGLERELPLPRVAVIGVQSCGKSSVLEGISGVCLPRGTGTVTRCPVELQMKFNPDPLSDWEGRLFCQNDAGQSLNRVLRNPSSVAEEVMEAQRFLAGSHGLSNKPITLEIRSPHVPDLTLIDLPGLIEVPMPNQPDDLPDKIYQLVKNIISTKETIIMVVVASNTEIACTKALKMANEVDPDGMRTLGVLTKPDLVDKGTEGEIMGMVAHPEKYRIRKGFTVVKLRSQADMDDRISLDQAHQNESTFFSEHSHYKHLAKDKVGTQSLSTKLTHELVTRIKEVLPSLREETHAKLMENEKSLQRLGVDVPKDMRERQHFLTDSLNRYVNKVCRICDGIYDADVMTDQRLLYWTRPVMEEFALTVEEMCPSSDDRTLLERIAKEIREQRGMELPGFLPFKACQVIIFNLLREFILPSKTCLFKYNACVETFLAKIAEEKFGTFPNLERAIKLKVDKLQRKAFEKCDEAIEEYFQMEYMVIIPDLLFYKGAYGPQQYNNVYDDTSSQYERKVVSHEAAATAQEQGTAAQQQQKTPQQQQQQQQKRGLFKKPQRPPSGISVPPPEVIPGESQHSEATGFTMDKIAAYFRSALDRLMGSVPMKVHWYLIKRLSEQIQSHVIAMATDPETLDYLLEDEKTAATRMELETRIDRLTAAHNELMKV